MTTAAALHAARRAAISASPSGSSAATGSGSAATGSAASTTAAVDDVRDVAGDFDLGDGLGLGRLIDLDGCLDRDVLDVRHDLVDRRGRGLGDSLGRLGDSLGRLVEGRRSHQRREAGREVGGVDARCGRLLADHLVHGPVGPVRAVRRDFFDRIRNEIRTRDEVGERSRQDVMAEVRRAGQAAGLGLVPAIGARVLAARHAEVEGLVERVELVSRQLAVRVAPSGGHRFVHRVVVGQDEVLEAA